MLKNYLEQLFRKKTGKLLRREIFSLNIFHIWTFSGILLNYRNSVKLKIVKKIFG